MLFITVYQPHSMQGDFRYIAKDELKTLGKAGLETNTLKELLAAVPANYREGVKFYTGSELLAGAILSAVAHACHQKLVVLF